MKLEIIAELWGSFRILLSVWSVLLIVGRGSYFEPLTLVLLSTYRFTYHVVHQSPLPTLSANQYTKIQPFPHPTNPNTLIQYPTNTSLSCFYFTDNTTNRTSSSQPTAKLKDTIIEPEGSCHPSHTSKSTLEAHRAVHHSIKSNSTTYKVKVANIDCSKINKLCQQKQKIRATRKSPEYSTS